MPSAWNIHLMHVSMALREAALEAALETRRAGEALLAALQAADPDWLGWWRSAGLPEEWYWNQDTGRAVREAICARLAELCVSPLWVSPLCGGDGADEAASPPKGRLGTDYSIYVLPLGEGKQAGKRQERGME